MGRKIFQRRGALRRDERGTAIVELALIAPVLALLTVGIVDLSRGVTRRMELSEAVHRTLEKAAAQNFKFSVSTTGAVTMDYEGALIADVVEGAGGEEAGVTEDDVEIVTWLECNGIEETDRTIRTCDPGETTARYLQIRIDSSFTPSFGTVVSPGTDGTVPLWAEAAVRIQ